MSMPERWPTHRIAMYGAFAGAAYAALLAWGHWTVSRSGQQEVWVVSLEARSAMQCWPLPYLA